jgi:hypothetical protein
MKQLVSSVSLRRHFAFSVAAAFVLGPAVGRAGVGALVDDFSNPTMTSAGAGRMVIDDKTVGSQSHATQHCDQGVLTVNGELVPGRGAPAFVSVPLLLAPDMKPQDASQYEGVRLRVKLIKGLLSVQVSTTDITNFDFHAAPVVGKRGEFVEVRVPFKTMKRAWSEQTALNPKNVTSVNLVSFGTVKDDFGYEVDEIGFY